MKGYFNVKFQHSADTMKRLSVVQYRTFQKGFIVLQVILALFFLYAGYAMATDEVVTLLFYFFGAWLLISWKQIPLFRAEKLLRSCGGQLPETEFVFTDECIRVENDQLQTQVAYSSIIRLTGDDRYDYLFISREGAYMLPRHQNEQKEKVFREFVAGKTGRKWRTVDSFFSKLFRFRGEKY